MLSNLKSVRVRHTYLTGSADIIGTIRYNGVDDGKPLNINNLPTAKPLLSGLSYYPTINEIVHIVAGPKDNHAEDQGTDHYYLPPIKMYKWNANNSAQPNEFTIEELNAGSKTGLDPLFTELKTIKPLQPYGGDLILEGRYGNSIRFGSTNTEESTPNHWSNEGPIGNPIIIIRNGQSGSLEEYPDKFSSIIENINETHSSIYLCSNQQITNFQKAGISPQEHPASYKHMIDDND